MGECSQPLAAEQLHCSIQHPGADGHHAPTITVVTEHYGHSNPGPVTAIAALITIVAAHGLLTGGTFFLVLFTALGSGQ